VLRCFIERIHVEAFAACHREVHEGFVWMVGLAVMMSEDFSHLGEAITATAFQR